MKRTSKALILAIACCFACFAVFALAGCQNEEAQAPTLKSPEISTPAIGQEGVLRVGVNTANSPLAGESSGKIIGIDVDVASAIADTLGLKVEIVDVGTEGVDAIKKDNVDIVLGIDSDSKEKGMWLSSEYLPTGIAVFVADGNSAETPEKGAKVKIAAQASSKSAWAVTNAFGEKCLVTEPDLASAFQALKSGEVEYVASDAIVGLYAAYRQDMTASIIELLGATSGYCAMVDGSNSELKEAIAEAIANITDDGIMGVIEDKWLDQNVADLSSLPSIAVKSGSSD